MKVIFKLKSPYGVSAIIRLHKFNIKQDLCTKTVDPQIVLCQSLSVTDLHCSGLLFDVECFSYVCNINDPVNVIKHDFLQFVFVL